MEKRFTNEFISQSHFGVNLDIRSTFAQELLRHWGVVAGTSGKEDSQGRATLILQEPKELVARAFAISDAFYDLAELREDIKEATVTPEQRAEFEGNLRRIALNAEFAAREKFKQSTK